MKSTWVTGGLHISETVRQLFRQTSSIPSDSEGQQSFTESLREELSLQKPLEVRNNKKCKVDIIIPATGEKLKPFTIGINGLGHLLVLNKKNNAIYTIKSDNIPIQIASFRKCDIHYTQKDKMISDNEGNIYIYFSLSKRVFKISQYENMPLSFFSIVEKDSKRVKKYKPDVNNESISISKAGALLLTQHYHIRQFYPDGMCVLKYADRDKNVNIRASVMDSKGDIYFINKLATHKIELRKVIDIENSKVIGEWGGCAGVRNVLITKNDNIIFSTYSPNDESQVYYTEGVAKIRVLTLTGYMFIMLEHTNHKIYTMAEDSLGIVFSYSKYSRNIKYDIAPLVHQTFIAKIYYKKFWKKEIHHRFPSDIMKLIKAFMMVILRAKSIQSGTMGLALLPNDVVFEILQLISTHDWYRDYNYVGL